MITIENTGSAAAPKSSGGVNGGAGTNAAAPADTAATVTIASLSDQDWYISRTHGVYHIPACAKGQSYALLMITARGDAIDLGDNRRFPFSISAREIAEDLLQDLHDHGIFVCAGARPTQEEIAGATARRDAFYHQLVADGDTMWARGHSFREISDLHRRAAIALGIEREWAYVPVRMAECPACGEKVKPNVAVCRHCGAILDAEKAARHGLGAGVKDIAQKHLVNAGVEASDRNDESISQRAISESSAAGGKSARGEAGVRSGK
ncbi:MAG: zinc ribbon domain-containing protein [Candidatus Acidiferrales bacterium]